MSKTSGVALKIRNEVAGEEKVDELRKSYIKLGQSFVNTIGTLSLLLKKMDIMTRSTDKFVVSQRILNNTFGEGTTAVNKYIKSLAGMTGLATADIAHKTALFGQMASSINLTNDQATTFVTLLDDMSAKLSLLYGTDFNSMAKAMLDAVKGQTAQLTTFTGIVTKTQTLQNTIDQLGLDLDASKLNSANRALLQYITIAKQVTLSNEALQKSANDVTYQKQLMKNQVLELGQAIGSVLYPILRAILPVLNAILIVITTIVNVFATLIGSTKKMTANIDAGTTSMGNFGDSVASTANKIKRSLRGFDKLNNITTPTPTSASGASGGGLDPRLAGEMAKLSQNMLDIKTRAHEIAESILEWMGFIYDINDETWKFGHITLGTIIGGLVGSGGIIWALSKVFGIFKKFKGTGGGLLSSIFGVASKTGSSAGGIGLPSFKDLLKGIGELTLVIGAITLLVTAMGALYKNEDFKELIAGGLDMIVTLFTGLGKIMLPLTVFSGLVALLGYAGLKNMASGTLGLIVAIMGIFDIVALLGVIAQDPNTATLVSGGINTLVSIFEGLSKIMLPLIIFNALIAGMGYAGLATMASGIAGFMIVVAGLFDIVALLGVMAQDPNIITLVNGGIDLLVSLGYGLGEFFGSIIGGFGAGLTSGLPAIGTNLSLFANNAGDFFNTIKGIDESSARGAKYLAETLFILTANDLLENIRSSLFIFGKKTTMEEFGSQLEAFGGYMTAYANAVKGIENGDVVEQSARSAKALAEVAKILPSSDGIMEAFTGNNDIDTWGEKLATFGAEFKEYADNVKGLDTNAIETSRVSAQSMIELAKGIPNSGGIKDAITGNNDIDQWGMKLVMFGLYFNRYSEVIAGLDTGVIENSRKSAESIVELANNIPYSGGFISWIIGKNSIDTFGKKLVDFGGSLAQYSAKLGSVDNNKINKTTKSIKDIVDIANQIKDNGLTSVLSEFGNSLKDTSKTFANVFTNSQANSIGLNFGQKLAEAIVKGIKQVKMPTLSLTEGSNKLATYKLNAYASGGFVDSGEVFVARENGLTEMVGHIGSHTAVANNDQIVAGIERGVDRALSRHSNMNRVVIEANGDTSGLLNFIEFKQKERDRQYGM